MVHIASLAVAATLALGANAQMGPGRGEWVVSSPESHGLSSAALQNAANEHLNSMSNRKCYIAIKNGEIVHEEYRNGGSISSTSAGWSTTKSSCAALYGIAIQQGWADVEDFVKDRNSGTRRCNNDAQFKHVLTMTGRSSNLDNPTFSYDTLGTQCLDNIADFITENNPDGLSAVDWKNKYWQEALGMEHMSWGSASSGLGCGFGQDISCRDLARSGQLFLNNGMWEGEQLMAEQFAKDSREKTIGTHDYGYTVWLEPNDPVDPKVSSHNGMLGQCVYISKEHEAMVVTMGNDGGCGNVWSASRGALVSNDYPMYEEMLASGALNITSVDYETEANMAEFHAMEREFQEVFRNA